VQETELQSTVIYANNHFILQENFPYQQASTLTW